MKRAIVFSVTSNKTTLEDGMNLPHNNLRMATVRWIGRLLAVSLDVGAMTVGEYNVVMKTLRSVAKKGETKEPEVPLRLVDGREAADILGISYSMFRALESEGVFPFRRKMLGKKTVRYRITDINNYILSDDATEKGTDGNEAKN